MIEKNIRLRRMPHPCDFFDRKGGMRNYSPASLLGVVEAFYPEPGPGKSLLSHPSLNHPTDEDLSAGTPDCAKDGAPHFCGWFKGGPPAK